MDEKTKELLEENRQAVSAYFTDTIHQVHSMIMIEFDYYLSPKRQDLLPQVYPKLEVMYQFFRLLRGEAFFDSGARSHAPDLQSQDLYYKMEYEIKTKLKEVKSKLDKNDPTTKRYIEEMQKWFELD